MEKGLQDSTQGPGGPGTLSLVACCTMRAIPFHWLGSERHKCCIGNWVVEHIKVARYAKRRITANEYSNQILHITLRHTTPCNATPRHTILLLLIIITMITIITIMIIQIIIVIITIGTPHHTGTMTGITAVATTVTVTVAMTMTMTKRGEGTVD